MFLHFWPLKRTFTETHQYDQSFTASSVQLCIISYICGSQEILIVFTWVKVLIPKSFSQGFSYQTTLRTRIRTATPTWKRCRQKATCTTALTSSQRSSSELKVWSNPAEICLQKEHFFPQVNSCSVNMMDSTRWVLWRRDNYVHGHRELSDVKIFSLWTGFRCVGVMKWRRRIFVH